MDSSFCLFCLFCSGSFSQHIQAKCSFEETFTEVRAACIGRAPAKSNSVGEAWGNQQWESGLRISVGAQDEGDFSSTWLSHEFI